MSSDPYAAALDTVRLVVERRDIIVCGNDIDLTLSAGTRQGEDDPRKTAIREDTGAALRALEAHGHIVGIITNRSGRQAARLLAERGIQAAEIVGTYGMEVFHADASDPDLGTATVDARFAPYARPITTVLRAVREGLYRELGRPDEPGRAVEVEIPTATGPLLLERKAVCAAFPEGLAHVYNFNLVADKRERARYVARLEEGYQAAARDAFAGTDSRPIWGVAPPETTPRDDRYSWAMEPLIAQGKGYGMTALIRAARRRLSAAQCIGMVTFAGDSNADGEAMRGARLIAACARREQGRERLRTLGIWVRPEGKDAPVARERADIAVDGPEGYARFLLRLAQGVSD